jgi:hypothetical protein
MARVVIPSRLVDYFVTVSYGTEPSPVDPASARMAMNIQHVRYKSCICDFYPFTPRPEFQLPATLPMFCMPDGIVFRDRADFPRQHSFILTGSDGARVYCTCVTFWEPLPTDLKDKLRIEFDSKKQQSLALARMTGPRRPASMLVLPTSQTAAPTESTDEASSSTTSTFENGEATDEDSQGVVSVSSVASPLQPRKGGQSRFPDLLFAPKTICILSHWPLYHTFQSFLVELYRLSISPCPIPLERIITNFVDEVPLPPSGKVAVLYTIGHEQISISRPARNEFPLCQCPITQLFEYLSVPNVLSVFTAMLLEKKILLTCSQYSVLTNVAEALNAIIFPFRWQHVYIPVLPQVYAEFLSAPVPFLMGIHSSALPGLQLSSEIMVVDIDHNRVTIPKDGPMPRLPEKPAEKLTSKLLEFVPSYGTHTAKLASADAAIVIAPPPDAVDEVGAPGEFEEWKPTFCDKSIREAFLRFFVAIFMKYRLFLRPSNMEDPFDIKGFTTDIPAQARKFLECFHSTQMFLQFCHERNDESLAGTAEIVFFDESIDAKLNRSTLRLRKKATPFLSDAEEHVSKTFVTIAPDNSDIPVNSRFTYPLFPALNAALIRPPRDTKVFVTEDSEEYGYRTALLASWKTVLATLAAIQAMPEHRTATIAENPSALPPTKSGPSSGHHRSVTFAEGFNGSVASSFATGTPSKPSPQGGTPPSTFMQRWRARLSRSATNSPETQPLDPSGSVLSDIFSASGCDVASADSDADIAHARVFEMLRFDLTDTCPKCDVVLQDEDVQKGWSNDRNDYRTTCPQCATRFVARFRVVALQPSVSSPSRKVPEQTAQTLSVADSGPTNSTPSATATGKPPRHQRKLSSEMLICHAQAGDDVVVNCEFLSPAVVRKEVFNCLTQGVAADEKFFLDHQTIFWNLILQFRNLPIPLGFLLPQVDWGLIAEHFRTRAHPT